MGWQDRDYSRGYRGSGGPMQWLVHGRVPLFRAFGIDVRAHASLVVMVVLGLLFGLGLGFSWQDRLESVAALFLIVLLHEFGHCFACRWVGGSADEIVMHPLGGLALCAPPHRALPTFITVAGGPAVNVLICLLCGGILFGLTGWLPTNPFSYVPPPIYVTDRHATLAIYSFWIYQMSWSLLIFNLLPIYPLDGGQMTQAILWPQVGYYRSMKLSTEVGMFAAVAGAAFALATGNFGLAILAGLGFYGCYLMRQQLLHNPPGEFEESMSYAIPPVRRPRKSWIASWRERRAGEAELNESVAVDRILEKVAKTGMNSLSGREKRTLAQATESQRRRDTAKARRY